MMGKERNSAFQAGDWLVQPELNSLSRDGVERHVEPKVMSVLLTLASHPNRVFSKEELIAAVWSDTFVGDDVLTRCISILRRVTEDDSHAPRFIQTVPKVGYRLVAAVSELQPSPVSNEPGGFLPPAEGQDGQLQIEIIPLELPILKSGPHRRRLLLGVVLAGLVMLLVAGGFWEKRTRGSAAETTTAFRTIQFTSFAGEQTQPAFSPDGRYIAFVRTPEMDTDISRKIYLKQIGSEAVTQLTSNDDQEFSPAWSPDGKQIAYLSRSATGLGIYIADRATRGPAHKIYIPQQPSHWEQGALSWSPDGSSLIFPDHSGSEPNSSIYQLNVRTRVTHSITNPPAGWEGDLNPAYSPDGKKIAFTRASETAVRDIYWISLADGKLHQLTHDRMNIDSLAWSADSSYVVFSSNRGGKYALWRMGLTKAEPQRLTVGTEDAFQPAVGPRADQLAYTQGSAIWSIVRLQNPGAKGAAPQPVVILSSTQQDSAPSLSPDGRFFAIQSLRSGSQEIWISSIAGDSLRQLTFLGGPMTGSPSWSPQGDKILFDSRPDGHSHIFMVPAAGGQPKQFTFGNDNDIVPRWSHDGQIIYFRSNRGGRWQLWKISANGGAPQPMTSSDGIVPQESPDGKYLYYTRGDEDGLWRVPTSGGPEARVLHQPAAGYWGYWQVTPRGIFYLDRTQVTPCIRIFNPESKQTSTFASLSRMPPPYAGISVANQSLFVLMTDERNAGRHITLVQAQSPGSSITSQGKPSSAPGN